MTETNVNPRPFKRQRTELSSPCRVSAAELLISLPAVLIHPPTHPNYAQSLALSLHAVRKCLSFDDLTPELECRAWTATVELAMRVIEGGYHLDESNEQSWARGIEVEAEKAITRGVLLSQKHPSLRLYRTHLTILSATLSRWQGNSKYARNLLRRLTSSFLPDDLPCAIYSAHLALITHLISPISSKGKATTNTSSPRSTEHILSWPDAHAALDAVSVLYAIASDAGKGHERIAVLAKVLKLRVLVSAEMWEQVGEALQDAESALELSFDVAPDNAGSQPSDRDARPTDRPSPTPRSKKRTYAESEEMARRPSLIGPFESVMSIHTLLIGVVYQTHMGDACAANTRLAQLHLFLDQGGNAVASKGFIEIPLPLGPPVIVQTTHPRVVLLLAFLVSSASRRDPIGRKPKRRLFAMEGLNAWERETRKDLSQPLWASVGDAAEIDSSCARIKADLLCELIGVAIARSEFENAESYLALLIAHTRTYDLFASYAARITLHHAHLAHTLGQSARARECYRVAAYLASPPVPSNGDGSRSAEAHWVSVSARAGEVGLLIGLDRGAGNGSLSAETINLATDVVRACRNVGGNLEAVGQIVEACMSEEILKSKQHLRKALNFTGKAADTHMRALVLSLITSFYLQTTTEQAYEMLSTCEQIAAGLGISSSTSTDSSQVEIVGNAPMRLWIGQCFLDLYRRIGKESRAERQATANKDLEHVVEQITLRGMASAGLGLDNLVSPVK